MNYEKFIDGYSVNLQILDAIDLLQHLDQSALDSLDQLGVGSKDDKICEEHGPSGPTP